MFLEDDKFKALLAISLGILMCILELFFTVFSIITLYVGGFFLIMLIVGIVSGRPKFGMLSALIILVVMIPLGFIFWPFFGMQLSLPENTFIALLLVMATMVWKPFIADEGDEIGTGIIQFLFVLFVAPVLYIGGIFVAAVGGGLGGKLWRRVGLNGEPSPSEIRDEGPMERTGL